MNREEAKTELQDLTNAIEELENRFPIKNPANTKTITALKMAIEALEQTRWIPVSERLPEMHEVLGILKKLVYMRSDEVIVTIRDNKNGSVVTHSECYLWEGKWHGDIFDWLKASKVDYEVIAWMPLPQPYKGESEESDADSN